MGKRFRYTTLAHRYTARYPMLTYVGTQINFWVLANLLLISIMHLQSRLISQSHSLAVSGEFGPLLLVGGLIGLVYGAIIGLTGYYLERGLTRYQTMGRAILVKSFASLVILFLLLEIVRYAVYEPFIEPSLYSQDIIMDDESWKLMFYLYLLYYFFMTLMISFINQINKKYGPGVLIPLLLGVYRNPREEDRIFLFMDLKSSTSIAEKLGHLKYSAFIRDCFSDINEMLYRFRAQVYQYVGDEIVVTWQEDEGIKNHYCIEFFFACEKQFEKRFDYFMKQYGVLPEFKASIHSGVATVVEIGELKRDIAYHGDTLNTAARIQSLCNDYNRNFLASQYILDKVGLHPMMNTEMLGSILLKGKSKKVTVSGVRWTDNANLSILS